MSSSDARFTTPDGTTYAYTHHPPTGPKPTFLFIHGCPSSRHDWRHQITALSSAGYGVLAPDCLGYGHSDKPRTVDAYNLRRLSGHIAQLLDHVGVRTVVGVAHDWGSMVMSRVVTWHPDRFERLVFMSAGYCAPGVFFDVDGLNVMSRELVGYEQLGYWYFFNSYDAEDIIAKNVDSFFHLAFPDDNKTWVTSLAAINGTRSWLVNNTTCPLPSFLTEEDKAWWVEINSQPDATAWVNYYRSLMRGTQAADEDPLTDEDRTLKVPVLAICGGDDMVTRADQIGGGTTPFASKGYREMVLEGAGHWVMLERKEEVSKALMEFAEEA